MRWRPLSAILASLLAAAGFAAPGLAEDVPARRVYERRRTSIRKTVRWLVGEASRHGAGQLLVVFDGSSFSPPPGLTEFSAEHLFLDDLPAWVESLGEEAARAGCPVRATGSFAGRSVQVGESGWKAQLRELVVRTWWQDPDLQRVEEATKWVNRLLQRTESGIAPVRGDTRRLLALVTGSVTPERWTFHGDRPNYELAWRLKLLRVGRYWDEEAIAARLVADGCRFYVIAPEAHFGDFRPFVELPQCPWASRPQLPPLRRQRSTGAPRPAPTTPGTFDEPALRRRLDEELKDVFPDPEERRRQIDRMIARLRAELGRDGDEGGGEAPPTTPGPVTPPPPATPYGGPAALHYSDWRFDSTTPYWFPRFDGTVFYNNHAPSGYGYWPYARVAAKTGGKYYFYPFPSSRWLDVCPRDVFLLDRLAPELIHETKYLHRLRGDKGFDALAKAANLVSGETPWADGFYDHRAASGWSSFRRAAPLSFHADWFLRRRPFDIVHAWSQSQPRDLKRAGRRIRAEVLPRYDLALEVIDRAIASDAAAANDCCHPRAMADLKLARFWFAMSAFHLEALSIYAQEVDRFIPDRLRGHLEGIWITYVPAIKLSDCLDAYDQRTLSLADEANYARWELPDQPGQQGNILMIPSDHPDFRAKRSLASVLKHIDPRLRRRAMDMVQSARRVMASYAKTGWGWTTYYSIAYTFIFLPVEGQRTPGARPGGKEPPPPTTPRGPGTGPGGSAGGGPTTGR